MSSTTDFTAILNTRADSVEAPKRLPPGKYEAMVKDFATDTSDKKKTPYVEFHLIISRPLDVAPEYQAQVEAAMAKGPVEMDYTFYLTEKSLYRMVDFMEQDLKIARGNRSIGEMLVLTGQQSCAVILDEEPSTKDPSKVYINVKATAPL